MKVKIFTLVEDIVALQNDLQEVENDIKKGNVSGVEGGLLVSYSFCELQNLIACSSEVINAFVSRYGNVFRNINRCE